MNRRFDSLLLGGAVLFGGLVNRRVVAVDRRIEDLAEDIDDIREDAASTEAGTPPVPGMPLPTGYGLQVRGPIGESILVPVCLPPGFELDSMMLCPEFLPRRSSEEPVPPAPVRIVEAVGEVEPERPAERMGGTVQYVFGGVGQGFTTRLAPNDDSGATLGADVMPMRPGVETHPLS